MAMGLDEIGRDGGFGGSIGRGHGRALAERGGGAKRGELPIFGVKRRKSEADLILGVGKARELQLSKSLNV